MLARIGGLGERRAIVRRSARRNSLRASVVLAALGVVSLVAGFGGTSHQAQTYSVSIDGTAKGANESFIAYFPNVVKVHPGDSVVFTWNGPGEPHTVTFGSLVDTTLNAFDKLTPAQQQNPPKSVIALDAKIPQLLPQGPGDAIQDAANPCFVASGVPPATGSCPQGDGTQPAFDGTQAYYNSGWGDVHQKFRLQVASGTAPGTYRFMCLLHREGMTGKLTVVSPSTPVPSPTAQAAAGKKALAAVQAKLAGPLKALRQGKPPIPVALPGANVVLAGSGSPDPSVVGGISEFGPHTVKIPVGGTVTWWIIGPHSISFDTNRTNDDIRATAPDGTVHLNPKAVVPVGGPGEPRTPPRGGSPTKPKFVVVASQSWNGRGHHSSGLFVNSFGPPVIEGYELTFTRAGTYKYLCTVHDNMKGTVVVGGG